MTGYDVVSKTTEKEGFDTHRRIVTVISLATLVCRRLKAVAVRRLIRRLKPQVLTFQSQNSSFVAL